MEHAIVTFKNPDNNKEIVISFIFDKQKSYLDYDVKLSKDYDIKDNIDFNGFLATMFLNSLQVDKDKKETDNERN